MSIPYNTGKVKIGCRYVPKPYIEKDRDMLLIQKCLLKKGNQGLIQFLINTFKQIFREKNESY